VFTRLVVILRTLTLAGLLRLALAAILLASAGCGGQSSGSSEPPAADYGRVRTMTSFYEAYLSEHRNQPPPGEQAFRDFLNIKQENFQKAELKIDEMFVSPRNSTPMQWIYGRKAPFLRQNGMACYAYETQPVGGKRLLIGSRGMFIEMDETQFRSLFPKG
jgi:hypothetical protein